MNGIKLKICGIRSVEEARQLLSLKPHVDYVGVNFIASSSRHISLETAQLILREFKDSDIKTVGLFAGHSAQEVNDYSHQLNLDYAQLHGEEPMEYARQIHIPVMRAIAVDPVVTADDILEFIDSYPADFFILDRPVQGQGDLINMEVAAQVVSARHGKVFLAGGLNPDNLPDILTQVQPYGIDIASGVRTDNHLEITKVSQCLEIIRPAN